MIKLHVLRALKDRNIHLNAHVNILYNLFSIIYIYSTIYSLTYHIFLTYKTIKKFLF